ncbi:MAG: hypothetical protein M1818_001113 [Claussenomyces sp. TS43310]|nr:MAG: hypothetical protein M1818_001113 [Claussenomyces sp. TS43310]
MSELLTFLSSHEEAFRRQRLAALYSDFRHLRTTNPDGYFANIEAWQKGITDAARAGCISKRGTPGDLLILKPDKELLRALDTKEWGRPLALGTVLRNAIARREMIPLQEFAAAKESIYQRTWTFNPWKAVTWSLWQLGVAGSDSGEDTLPAGQLVLLTNVEAAARELRNRTEAQMSRTDSIYTRELFSQEFSTIISDDHPMSADDIEVLLRFLSRDKGMITYDGQTVKFIGSSDADPTITSEDTTIAALKSLILKLEAQIDRLSKRIEVFDTAAHDAVVQKNRVLALAALRSKKLVQSNLTRQTARRGQLEEIYSKIGQASDQVELIRIMEASTIVLRNLNAEAGGVERADKIVDYLKEQMTQVEEVGNVIAEPGQGVHLIDEDELHDELEAMAEDKRRREIAEQLEKEATERPQTFDADHKLNTLDVLQREGEAQKGSEGSSHTHTGDLSHDVSVDENLQKLGRMSLEDRRRVATTE